MAYHVIDMLRKCRCIMELGQDGIDRRVFRNGFKARDILDAIMGEA